jgi:hypothetical protein
MSFRCRFARLALLPDPVWVRPHRLSVVGVGLDAAWLGRYRASRESFFEGWQALSRFGGLVMAAPGGCGSLFAQIFFQGKGCVRWLGARGRHLSRDILVLQCRRVILGTAWYRTSQCYQKGIGEPGFMHYIAMTCFGTDLALHWYCHPTLLPPHAGTGTTRSTSPCSRSR